MLTCVMSYAFTQARSLLLGNKRQPSAVVHVVVSFEGVWSNVFERMLWCSSKCMVLCALKSFSKHSLFCCCGASGGVDGGGCDGSIGGSGGSRGGSGGGNGDGSFGFGGSGGVDGSGGGTSRGGGCGHFVLLQWLRCLMIPASCCCTRGP